MLANAVPQSTSSLTDTLLSRASPLPHFFRVLLKTQLAPAFVDGDRYGVGQVEAAAALTHRQSQAMTIGQGIQHLSRQPTAFRAKQEGIAFGEADIMERLRTLGGERKQARVPQAFQAAGQVRAASVSGSVILAINSAASAFSSSIAQ